MNRSVVMGSVIGAIVVTAAGALAGYRVVSVSHSAEVVSVKALNKTIKTPRQECRDEQVTRTRPVKDRDRLVGTGVGAVVGGLLGHEVGGGSGKVLATVAGAAAGGYAGNKIQQKVQQGDTYTTTERQCTTVYDRSEVPAGYEVLYRLNGKEQRVHMDHDPGKRIPVKDGHIVTDTDAQS
ncbi:MAG TPA: glycine zipper 2TM domain-containing protein [Steroidobacteraceae bacterium]